MKKIERPKFSNISDGDLTACEFDYWFTENIEPLNEELSKGHLAIHLRPLDTDAMLFHTAELTKCDQKFIAQSRTEWPRALEALELAVGALEKVSNNQFIQYGHGKTESVSELTHQYKIGVTDGHRLAKTWAEQTLTRIKEILEK